MWSGSSRRLLGGMVGRCYLKTLRVVVTSLIVVPGSVGARALALEIDDLASIPHDLGQLQDVLVGITFVRGGLGERVGVSAQSFGSGLRGTEFVIAATLVVGLFVGDDPPDGGRISSIEGSCCSLGSLVTSLPPGNSSRSPGNSSRSGDPARRPAIRRHHHLAFNDSPSPIRRLRTSR